MDIEDKGLVKAEREASPERYDTYDPDHQLVRDDDVREERGKPVASASNHERGRIERSRSSHATEESNIDEGKGQEEVEEAPPRSHRGSDSSSSLSASSLSTVQQASLRGTNSQTSRPAMMSMGSTKMEEELFAYLERHPTAIRRIENHRLQHSYTVGSTLRSRTSRKPLPPFGGNKPYPPLLPEREEYVVEFESYDDPLHAQNWTMKRKLYISAILILDSFAATFASSIFSNAAPAVGEEFGVGSTVTTLGTSLFVLGYAFGPIVWAPMSELYGRRVPIIVGSFGFGVFMIAVAVAKDLQTVMLGRFFGGLFGSCPLAVVAAVFADMYNNKVRGLAITSFGATVFMGPLMGPFVGGFLTTSIGWRWTAYIPALMGFVSCILVTLFQHESYGPVILVSKASELRRKTLNWGIHAKQEEVEVDLKELLVKNVSRPLRILFTEPIVLLVTLYMSFLYGLLYLFLTAYSIVFQQRYGWSPGVAGLPYFGFIAGEVIGFIVIVFLNPAYVRKLEQNEDVPVPEWRLPIVMAGGISFTIGLFWFGWAGYQGDAVHWIAPTMSGLASGFGIFTVFLQLLNYIVDSYLAFAASAIAANTFLRSVFGAIFPLFASYMFEGIGINYGMTLLGCVAALLIPMPFVFYFYGKRIRGKSKFAPAPDLKLDRQREQEGRDVEQGGGDGGEIEKTDGIEGQSGSDESGGATGGEDLERAPSGASRQESRKEQ